MTSKKAAVQSIENAGILAYSVPDLAKALGISDRQLYKHIDRGDLTAKYSGAKKIIPVSEARRFLEELPDEDLGALA